MPPANHAVHVARCLKAEFFGQLLPRIGPYTQRGHAERAVDHLDAQPQDTVPEAVAKTVPFDVSDHAAYRDPYATDAVALLAAAVGREGAAGPP
ncbi:hypothetical protein ACPEIC_10260 [Stenotrophomonas sp. NPDC087984]